MGERISEPARQKPHACIQQPVSFKVGLDLVHRDGQVTSELVVRIAGVLWIALRVRVWQTLERISQPYDPFLLAVRLQDGAHEYGSSSSPYAGFHEIARYVILDDIDNTRLQVVKTAKPNHGLRV